MTMTIAAIAESYRAEARARAILKTNDKIVAGRCGGAKPRFVFRGWDGHWIMSYTRSDISPRSIVRLNGEPVSFLDPPWWGGKIDGRTGRPWGSHGSPIAANEFAMKQDEPAVFLRAWSDGSAFEEWPEFYRELAREQTLEEMSSWNLG